MFEDRFGALRPQFELEVEGAWDGAILTLLESFAHDDGQREQRIWLIEKVGDQSYRGSAEGVIGVAEVTRSGLLIGRLACVFRSLSS